MIIAFVPILKNNTIEIYDISPYGQQLPQNIWSYYLQIQCSKLPSIEISEQFDIISYLQTQRIQQEIFTIKSEHLGLGNTETIPDGVYHLFLTINELYKKEVIFVIYKTVEDAIEQLMEDTNYAIEIGDYDVTYVGDTVDTNYKIETVRLAINLKDTLIAAAKNDDEVLANNTLDKLQRLLGILT
jgi:hypothetical protein